MSENKKIWNKEILNHPLLQLIQNENQAEKLQIEWEKKLRTNQKVQFRIKSMKDVNIIAGVDVSYSSDENSNLAISCAVLWDIKSKKIVDYKTYTGNLLFPYIPGFLGFRENRLIAQAILKLERKPDVIMCDGHGIIHPYHFGEAVHLGLVLNIPTFGIAKNPYVGRSNWEGLKRIKGKKIPVFENLEQTKVKNALDSTIGYALCLKTGSKPIFISIGTNITLELTIKIALASSFNHRQPEPLFFADQISRKKLRELQEKKYAS